MWDAWALVMVKSDVTKCDSCAVDMSDCQNLVQTCMHGALVLLDTPTCCLQAWGHQHPAHSPACRYLWSAICRALTAAINGLAASISQVGKESPYCPAPGLSACIPIPSPAIFMVPLMASTLLAHMLRGTASFWKSPHCKSEQLETASPCRTL